jgi:DNA-binding protein H-NS
MADQNTGKMTEWLDIKLDTLSSEERLRLIEEIFATLSPQELISVRDLAEKTRGNKLAEAKAAVLEEMKGKLSALGLSLNDVIPSRQTRKNKRSVSVKYRSPDGETWSGRGHAPLWLRQLELQGHSREGFFAHPPKRYSPGIRRWHELKSNRDSTTSEPAYDIEIPTLCSSRCGHCRQ